MFKTLKIRSIKLTARFYSSQSRFRRAKTVQNDDKDDSVSFELDEPVKLKQWFRDVPAISKWFMPLESQSNSHELNIVYLESFADTPVTLELTRPNPESPQDSSFERFEAPLALLLSHMATPEVSQSSPVRLYLAQQSLSDLPSPLQADIPTPTLLAPDTSPLGRGDIYASSLWMGKPPTRTPLHRDPNPNLFVQLAGKKVIRLMRPEVGRSVYERVRRELGEGTGRANMRGVEMMVGWELEVLENAVWGSDQMDTSEKFGYSRGVEAELESGDGLYIPLGWWHAVRGVGSGANASANWWFR